MELNNPASPQSRRATGANSANGVPPGPWDFPPTQLTEWLQQDPGEVATILSYPLIDHGASPLKLCGKGSTITLQLTGPNREACFTSLKWHSGLESPNDTTVFNHSVSITSGADESISLVLATLGAVHKYTFPVTVVTGAPDLLISVRVPLRFTDCLSEWPLRPRRYRRSIGRTDGKGAIQYVHSKSPHHQREPDEGRRPVQLLHEPGRACRGAGA